MVHSLKYVGPKGRTACHTVPGQGDKGLHAGQGTPRMGIGYVEMGEGGVGGGGSLP